MSRLTKLRTYAALGPANITRVATYRLGLKSAWHPVQHLRAPVARPPFFRASERKGDLPAPNTAWDDALWWFGWRRAPLPDGPPDWFANPFSQAPQPDNTQDWWRIPDFGAGDIKGLWELSRLDWAVAWATKSAGGDTEALARLNLWLADWAQKNPPYKGPNWKCGQEASIRVMHLITAAVVLGQDESPEQGLIDLLIAHLQRISPTMSYAIGQQNNHGTSEAAALFIGGSFLGGYDPRAAKWARKGRHWLEERSQALIAPDGSFSQYSVNYHRVLLDTYSLAEAWRRHRDLEPFSPNLFNRLAAATRWLEVMVDRQSGDAPIVGANDGARLIPLTDSNYRDYRPCVQLAAALFESRDAFGHGSWNDVLRWLNVPDGKMHAVEESVSLPYGGFHVLRVGSGLAVMRFPRFRFRPSQADALHVDLWYRGQNLLRDAGTYSYNSDYSSWFSSTEAHNTVAFDGRDQMPRIGRFLFGDWLKADMVDHVQSDGTSCTAAAAYTDGKGARHHRRLKLSWQELVCEDTVSGDFRYACLRWRLPPYDWRLEGNVAYADGVSIAVFVDGSPVTPTLETALESRYYLKRREIPVLVTSVDHPTTFVTRVNF